MITEIREQLKADKRRQRAEEYNRQVATYRKNIASMQAIALDDVTADQLQQIHRDSALDRHEPVTGRVLVETTYRQTWQESECLIRATEPLPLRLIRAEDGRHFLCYERFLTLRDNRELYASESLTAASGDPDPLKDRRSDARPSQQKETVWAELTQPLAVAALTKRWRDWLCNEYSLGYIDQLGF